MIRDICELTSNLLQNFLMVWFISDFCGYKYKGTAKYIGFAAVWMFGFAAISIINYFTDYDGLISAISVMGFVIYAQICLKDKTAVHIFISIASMVIVFTIASFMMLAAAAVSQNEAGALFTEFSAVRLIVLLLCRTAELAVFKTILHIKEQYNLTYREWLLFMAVLVLTWIEVILFTKASIISKEIGLYMFGAAVAAAIINILIYYFFVYINRAMQLKTELSLVKMQYDNVKNTEENMKLLYDNIHGIKHDLEKHFLYIKTMEENGRGDDVIKYIDNVLGEQMNASHKMVFTDNDIFNALMNVRLAICNEKGIYPSINVESKAIDEIRTEDIAILFGNVFDNAIEAAEKTEDKIIIFTVMLQKDYISVYVENSFDGVFDEKLKSTKSDKHGHGMGLKNVRRIVDKYDGMLKCFPDGNMFCCDILLKRQVNMSD